ncbi:MAG: hypothetical protein AAGF97_17710, partial [Planctomycetota bacterium]
TTASYRLDWPHGDWTPIASVPELNGRGKIGGSAVTIGGAAYVIGGYTVPGNEVTEHRLFRYDAMNNDYVELPEVPTEVDDTLAGVYQDRYLFLVSGWHGPIGDNVLDVQVYDTVNETWQSATSLPGPNSGLFGHAGTLIGNQIISFDGTQVAQNRFVISDQVYAGTINPTDLTDIDWQPLAPHPGAATYRAAATQGATSDGKMLVIGGTDNPYNFNGHGYNGFAASPLDQALLYDPGTQTWEELDIVGDPLATMDHRGLVSVGDGWATVGGMTARFTATDQVVFYRLVPEPSGGLLGITFLISLLACRRSQPPE